MTHEQTTGSAIKRLRTALGISQEALAARLGVTLRTVFRYESAQAPKSVSVLSRLATLAREHGCFDLADYFNSAASSGEGKEVADAIRHLRARLGETQSQFANRMRMCQSTIARYETSPNAQVGQEALRAFSQLAWDNDLGDLGRLFETFIVNPSFSKRGFSIDNLDRLAEDDRTIAAAIRSLRIHLGETQQQFSNRLGVVVRTVARWELEVPPRGLILVKLAELARECGRPDLMRSFAHPMAKRAGVIAHAVVALDGKANAMEWLQQPNRHLGDKTPLQIVFTDEPDEVERVDELLSALENGIHATSHALQTAGVK